jgi:hypothetical protein
VASTDKQTVEAILYLMSKKQFHILECEALAKVLGHDYVHTFELVGPKGRRLCIWSDPHYGIFEMEGANGSFMTNQFQFVGDVHVEKLCGR